MKEEEQREEAQRLLQMALELQGMGRLDEAISLYQKSADLHATGEAYTFMGWAMSLQGQINEAIRLCRQAIEVDPDFGNPYNDIGSYLLRQGDLDEAIGWLEKATRAQRYEPRHFPHINLAQVYQHQGKYWKALEQLNQALSYQPDDVSILRLKHQVQGLLN